MDFVKGAVVLAKAGRDKGSFFTVLESDGAYALICDGKRRSLECPKRKNCIHLSLTTAVLEAGSLQSNRAIRNALRSFSQKDRVPLEEG